jgi:hypothetical protein
MRPIDALVWAAKAAKDEESLLSAAADYARAYGITRADLERTLRGDVAAALAEPERRLT